MRSLVFLSLLFIISCNNKPEEPTTTLVKSKSLIAPPVTSEKIIGTYIGDFNGSPIAITSTEIKNCRERVKCMVDLFSSVGEKNFY